MSDPLRDRLIRLAHSQPKLRPHLLPLLKEGAGPVPEVKEAVSSAKVPLRDRPPMEQLRYWAGTARNALEAGAPLAAKAALSKAWAVARETPEARDLVSPIQKALDAVNSPDPRSADPLLEQLVSRLPRPPVRG